MLVSVIIPCFNAGKFIEKCLNSVFNQVYGDIEVILIDDGSTDDTLTNIESYLSVSSKTATLIEQENKGASAARNRGLQEANGEYIQFLDADDWIKPRKIEEQINLVIKNKMPDMVVGSLITEDESGECLFTKIYDKRSKKNKWLNLISTNLGITSSNLFKGELFKNGITWDETLKSSQEYNLMFDILKLGARICYDSQINTVIVRRKEGSISTMNVEKSWCQYLELRRRILEWMESNKISIGNEEYQAVFDAIRMSSAYNFSNALNSYKTLIPKSFTPSLSKVTSKLYVLCYQIFGFEISEKLWILKNKFLLKVKS